MEQSYNPPQKTSRRIDAIDVVKGIGSLLIVIGHRWYEPQLLILLYAFHIPVFFIVSGLCFNDQKYPTFISFAIHRVKTLLIPYFTFGILFMLYYYLSAFLVKNDEVLNAASIFQQISGFIASRGSEYIGINGPLWFVTCLFVVECLFYFINSLCKRLSPRSSIPLCAAILVIVCFGWFLRSTYCSFDSAKLPWSIDAACFSIGFYAIGYLVKKPFFTQMAKQQNYPLLILTFILAFILLYLLAYKNGKISIGHKIYHNGFLLYLTGVLGSICMFSLGKMLRNCVFLRFCGKNSFVFMAVQVWGFTLFDQATHLMGIPDSYWVSPRALIPIAFSILFCSIFSLLYNKVKSLFKAPLIKKAGI